MDLTALPFIASLDQYERQADTLLAEWRAGDPAAIQVVRQNHPRFLDDVIRWLPKRMSEAEVRGTTLDVSDARLTLARWYDFDSWPRLVEHVAAVTSEGSAVRQFESAVEAVIDGDVASLARLLKDVPDLIRGRSARVTHFDPPVHRATLLHYVAANGVEGHRQRTPANAPEIARLLLDAGTEPDVLADMYGGQHTTMSMLVSSSPPAQAGVQVALVHALLDAGAAIEGRGAGQWTSPLMTALVLGFQAVADTLVRRGARVDTLPAAAGLGRLDDVRRLLGEATADDRHRALALAAQLGHVEIVSLLLDAGEDPDRHNPAGMHAHATPLHQAVWGGHAGVVRVLVERGARLDIADIIYQANPLGWALHGGRTDIAEYLRAHGATAGQ